MSSSVGEAVRGGDEEGKSGYSTRVAAFILSARVFSARNMAFWGNNIFGGFWKVANLAS